MKVDRMCGRNASAAVISLTEAAAACWCAIVRAASAGISSFERRTHAIQQPFYIKRDSSTSARHAASS